MKARNSFPYLVISQQFNIDYGSVLLYAEWLNLSQRGTPHHREARNTLADRPDCDQIVGEIHKAIDEFAVIQREGWD